MTKRYLSVPDCDGYKYDSYRDIIINGRGKIIRSFLDKEGDLCVRLVCNKGDQIMLKKLEVIQQVTRSGSDK